MHTEVFAFTLHLLDDPAYEPVSVQLNIIPLTQPLTVHITSTNFLVRGAP